MRFSIAALAALAAGAVATTTTDIIYDTTTWCPEEASSTPVVQSSSVQTPIVKPTPSITTDIVKDYTTWCPEATVITHGSQTYSVTKPTSLTMSNGPYTVSRPLLSKTVTYCNKCAGPTAPAGSSPSPSSASVAPVYSGSSVVVPSVPGASQVPGTPASSTPVAPAFTGAASRHIAGAGAGLTAVLGVAAFLL
ncbi:hypothetical protein DTO166G4_8310 [Paecilomyces variotii]|nr:hypothetical protein DTO166G4_8310 [Paecilomyces variotii]KAJ9218412.1 hypothetical protein DTO169C6_9245 [Paecilomyces variotii]KAJ9228104.1 hypothetical protein DTO166G5_8862 [Paecilomyces variotii]KAJ9250556.1 hypothetical protein DTO207G8_5933 [Paecilomyces variotii]KAJ9326336.1 hypothetical protein DTO027B3_2650 [Paecilomyces variotii]